DLIEISGGTYEQPKLLGLEGMEEEEKQQVAESTMLREAYFVDFALAMQEKVSIPLMVTGGFRQRLVMEQALESGSADMVGLGRPMCVMTDAPKQLMAGLEELPRYEDELSLFPSWLGFLSKVKALRAAAGFAVQYWFYGQIDAIGRTGQANPQLTVFKATQETMALQKKLTKK
ncbi:NADH:flavin oxidoreductase, partial [bacterium]|nr:NADH:flavin oxidoreductase [bacterium]